MGRYVIFSLTSYIYYLIPAPWGATCVTRTHRLPGGGTSSAPYRITGQDRLKNGTSVCGGEINFQDNARGHDHFELSDVITSTNSTWFVH